MHPWFKLRSPRGKWTVVLTILALASGFIYIIFFGLESAPVLDRLQVLTLADTAALEDVWFDDAGNLVALYSENQSIHLKIWKSSNLRRGAEVNIDRDLSSAVLEPGKLYYARGKDPSEAEEGLVPFAIDQNAEWIAWAAGGQLVVKSLRNESSSYAFPYGAGEPCALSFGTRDYVNILLRDGSIKVWNYISRQRLRGSANIEEGWSLWSRDGDLLVSSFRTGDIGIIRLVGQTLESRLKLFEPGKGSVLASKGGEIAIGTNEGRVVIFSGLDEVTPRPSIPLESTRAMHALSFGEDSVIFAGGDFSGIYMISEDASVRISTAPSGVRYIDYSNGNVAYATTGSIECARLSEDTKLTDRAELVIALVSLIVSLLAIWFSVDQDSVV
jgi:hypothetical protein